MGMVQRKRGNDKLVLLGIANPIFRGNKKMVKDSERLLLQLA